MRGVEFVAREKPRHHVGPPADHAHQRSHAPLRALALANAVVAEKIVLDEADSPIRCFGLAAAAFRLAADRLRLRLGSRGGRSRRWRPSRLCRLCLRGVLPQRACVVAAAVAAAGDGKREYDLVAEARERAAQGLLRLRLRLRLGC